MGYGPEILPEKRRNLLLNESKNRFLWLAQRVGFEPTVPLLVHLISSRWKTLAFAVMGCPLAALENGLTR